MKSPSPWLATSHNDTVYHVSVGVLFLYRTDATSSLYPRFFLASSLSLYLYRFIYTASSRSVHLGRLISIDSSLSLHLHCFVCTDSYRFIRTNSSLSPLYSQHIWLSCAKFSGTLEGSSGRRRIATTDKTGAGSCWLVSVRFVYLGRSFVWRSLVLKKICSDRFSFVFSTKNFEVCCRNLGSYCWLPFVGYC